MWCCKRVDDSSDWPITTILRGKKRNNKKKKKRTKSITFCLSRGCRWRLFFSAYGESASTKNPLKIGRKKKLLCLLYWIVIRTAWASSQLFVYLFFAFFRYHAAWIFARRNSERGPVPSCELSSGLVKSARVLLGEREPRCRSRETLSFDTILEAPTRPHRKLVSFV